MEKLSDIHEELKGLQSPLLQLITNKNVYKVPQGYFDEFPIRVLGDLQMQAENEDIPMDYFSNLSDKILARVKLEDSSLGTVESVSEELKEISPAVLHISKENVFTVPVEYFANLSDGIIGKIKASEGYTVAEELQVLSPTVARIGRENVYAIPKGYFESNINNLPARQAMPEAKVVKMGRIPAIVRYMVAAAFVGVLGFSIFNLVEKNDDTPTHGPIVMAEAEKLLESSSLDAAFEKISEQEIENYLLANGHDIDAAVAAAAINNEDLPNPLDYLIDENTLADYLKLEKQIN